MMKVATHADEAPVAPAVAPAASAAPSIAHYYSYSPRITPLSHIMDGEMMMEDAVRVGVVIAPAAATDQTPLAKIHHAAVTLDDEMMKAIEMKLSLSESLTTHTRQEPRRCHT